MVECHVRVCRRHRLRNVNDFLMTLLKILGGKSPLFGSEVSPVTTHIVYSSVGSFSQIRISYWIGHAWMCVDPPAVGQTPVAE